jgi:hypothetical protein
MKRMSIAILVVLCLSSIIFSQETWTSRTSGTNNFVTGIAYGNNLYILVSGSSGTIITSPDAVTWTSRTLGTTRSLCDVTYGNNQFVAVGGYGTIRTSPDGITWTNRTFDTTEFAAVCYGNNLYVATGSNGSIFTSPDGIFWTSRTSGTTVYLGCVIYANNQFVVLGNSSPNGVILTSPDGISWTTRYSPAVNELMSVTYGNGLYVVVGPKIRTSSDNGITWIERNASMIDPTAGYLTSVVYDGHRFVAGSNDGLIITSSDGISWTVRAGFSQITCLNYRNNLFVAVGGAGKIYTSPLVALFKPKLVSPTDGICCQSTTPTLKWNTDPEATTYRVQVSTSSSFTSLVVDDSTSVDTTITLKTALSGSALYYWRMNAKNTAETSVWSNIRSFNTVDDVPAVPTLTMPANTATDIALTPTLTWGTVVGAARYRVQVSTVSTFATTVVDDSTLTTGTKAVTGLANNSTYYWRANAKNTSGTSAWAVAYSFTTAPVAPAAPVLIAPADSSAEESSLALTWGTVTGASTYRVQVSSVSTFASTRIDDSTLTAGSKSIVLTYPGMAGTNYWRVNAKNAGGTSAWSTVYRFFYWATGIVKATPHYVSATMGHNGVLEVYMANGSRVMEIAYGASATKTQLLNTASKTLAKGYYTYRFRSNDANVEIVGKLVK